MIPRLIAGLPAKAFQLGDLRVQIEVAENDLDQSDGIQLVIPWKSDQIWYKRT